MTTTQPNPCVFCAINQQCTDIYHNGTTDTTQITAIATDPLTQGTIILAETPHLTVFRPRDPVTSPHLLIVTKQHIDNVKALNQSHVWLVEHMMEVGYYCMKYDDKLSHLAAIKPDALPVHIPPPMPITQSQTTPLADIHYDVFARGWVPQNGLRFVFHKPPFNSVNHLHMHVQKLPYLYYSSIAMYAPGSYWCDDAVDVIKEIRQRKAPPQQQKQQTGIQPIPPSNSSIQLERANVLD